MKNVLLWGFESKLVRSVWLQLEQEGYINIKKWMVDKEYSNEIFFKRISCVEDFTKTIICGIKAENIKEIVPEKIYIEIMKHQDMLLFGYARDYFFYRKPIYEYYNLINIHMNYFYSYLKTHSIDVMIFSDVPHGHHGDGLMLYLLAKALGIKTIILAVSFFPEKYEYCSCIEKIGLFKTRPIYIQENEKISLDKSYKKDLYYMATDVIKRDMGQDLNRKVRIITHPQQWFTSRKRIIIESLKKYFDKKEFLNVKINRIINDWAEKTRFIEQTQKITANNIDFSIPYVYFPLHLQPEMTTDVLGGIYRDQLLAIEKLCCIIPQDWKIYVKENPKQQSYMRDIYFFKRMALLPQVEYIDREIDTYKLMEHSQFVATITGTAGWEAISGGKPVMIFGNAWYRDFPGVFEYNDKIDIQDIVNYKIDHSKVENILNDYNKSLLTGVFRDDVLMGVKDLNFMENEKNLYKGFRFLLDIIEKQYDSI